MPSPDPPPPSSPEESSSSAMDIQLPTISPPTGHRGREILAGSSARSYRGRIMGLTRGLASHRGPYTSQRGSTGPSNSTSSDSVSHSSSPTVPVQENIQPVGCRGPQNQPQIDWQWINTFIGGNYNPLDIPFQGQSGLRNAVSDNATAIDFFNLYLTDRNIQKICDETNRYANQFIQAQSGNLKPHSIVHDWRDTDVPEMKTFLGLCILMGVINKPRYGRTGLKMLSTAHHFSVS